MSEYRLLAKSLNWNQTEPTESQLLCGHLRDVHASAITLAETTGSNQLQALGLKAEEWLPRLQAVVGFAAAIHDLGKANDHFQAMLQSGVFPHRRNMRQGLRHEWVSLLLAAESDFGLHDWLRPAVSDVFDWQVALWAVSGHHPAYGRPSPPRLHVEGTGAEMQVHSGHPDFQEILAWFSEEFSLGQPPKVSDRSIPLTRKNNAFLRIFHQYRDSMEVWESANSEQRAFAAAVKNCLVGADIAGSALPKKIHDREQRSNWIASGFEKLPSSDEITEMLAGRLDVNASKVDEALRDFQRGVKEGPERGMLVKAGCGTGKTIAAYLWGRDAAAGRRLVFCYPTTGTATQGFADHFVIQEEHGKGKGKPIRSGAGLFHSRQEIDFEMLGVKTDFEQGVEEFDEQLELSVRVEALDAWSTPIVNCTADFVLGLIQNNRRGLYSWPALAGAAFILDEIHAYDDRMFGALLRFISAMKGSPILLMTASLPTRRRELLKQCYERLENDFLEIGGPKELESLKRYHREDVDDVLSRVELELAENGKVLWVCNTVQRAMDVFDEAVEAGLEPILYHSRFKYADRVDRHKNTIEKFRSNGPALVVATQVAEMSLDISATLLVSDLCPVPSLIQRLGRLNRNAKPPKNGEVEPNTMPFITIEPAREDGTPFHLPYTPEDLEQTRQWLEFLNREFSNSLSQSHLAEAWEGIEDQADRRPAFIPSAWLDGGPTTDVLELREGSPGVNVILNADAEAVDRGDAKLGNLTIPMPPPPVKIRQALLETDGRDKRIRGCLVVTNELLEYSDMRGGQWRKSEK